LKKRFVPLVLVFIVGAALIGLTQLQGQPAPAFSADVVSALSGNDTAGFARAGAAREFKFPQDYGAHPEFQTEWWYNTGNLATADGRRFGIKFTIFRRALSPQAPARDSDWATNQVYSADFAVVDISADRFIYTNRFSRGAAGLAGAVTDPRVKIWIEDWAITATEAEAHTFRLQAADGPIAVDLTLSQAKPVVLEGDHGLSVKSPEPGSASYYYSLTRLLAQGTLTVNGTTYPVSGTTWMDREFSTGALSQDTLGWDWFALQLNDGREIMLYQIRKQGGSVESTSDGTLVGADGSTTHLSVSDYTITPLGHWTSPHTGAVYPSGWRLTIKTPTGPIQLEVMPLMRDQELNTTTAYWEGASRITGTANGQPLTGYGYVELTGYNRPQTGW
jgi:predicted secreted hydrolase